jgi:hypothetical protein
MNMGIQVQELIVQLKQRLPIETTSAQMKADLIGEGMYAVFFQIRNTRGICFIEKDHEEMVFDNSWLRDRSAGLDYFRVRSNMDPRVIQAYIKEPAFTAKFDVALAQTHLVTPFSATVAQNPERARHINLFGTTSLQSASHTLAHYMTECNGDSTSMVVNSYHGWMDFLDSHANFDKVYPDPVPMYPYFIETLSVLVSMKAFTSHFGFYTFRRTLREDYVGTVDDLPFKAICGILGSWPLEIVIRWGKPYLARLDKYPRKPKYPAL